MSSKSVKEMLQEFCKDYNDPDIARLGMSSTPVPRLATGWFSLDLALGGGFPEGRCSVVFGTEGAMKTTIALRVIAAAQKKYPDKKAVFVDIEGHFDAHWAKINGVNTDIMGYIIPDTAESFVEMVEGLLYTKDISVVVCDSLAALVTGHELSSEVGKAMVGTQGILINKFYRRVSRSLSQAKAKGLYPTLLCINQIREKVGVMYGSPETQPGGRSFRYASSLTVRVSGKDEFNKDAPNVGLPAFKNVSECKTRIKYRRHVLLEYGSPLPKGLRLAVKRKERLGANIYRYQRSYYLQCARRDQRADEK